MGVSPNSRCTIGYVKKKEEPGNMKIAIYKINNPSFSFEFVIELEGFKYKKAPLGFLLI